MEIPAVDPAAHGLGGASSTATNRGLDPGADALRRQRQGSTPAPMFPPPAQVTPSGGTYSSPGRSGSSSQPSESSEPRSAEHARRVRTDRATHIGLGHGDGPPPQPAGRIDQSSSDIIPHAGGAVQVRSAPVSEAPPTQQKPRIGEPPLAQERSSNAARVRPRPNLERRPLDDEVTMQRDLSALREQIAATTPGLYDDLDEETSVIQKDGLRLAAGQPRAEDSKESRAAAAPAVEEPRASTRNPDAGQEVGASTDVVDETPTESPPDLASEIWASKAKAPARSAALTALRVAVLGTSIAGEVRLVALPAGSQAPMGAAAAILVPLTEEDADCIAKLFETSQ